MANTLEDLAVLAALIGGTAFQNKQISRHNRTILEEQRRAEALKKTEADDQRKRFEQQFALQRAEPFMQVFTAGDSADRLHNMAQQGTLGGFLDNADALFKQAGIPFDVNRFRVRAPRTEVDVAGLLGGGNAPPVGAPADGTFAARPQGPQPGTPVPQFNRLQPDMAGPPTPIANLPDERLRSLFGGLPQGMQGPPTPSSAMTPPPEINATAAPAVEPFDEEEAYRERYKPSTQTQVKQANSVSQTAHRLAQQGLWKTQEEKNEATTETMRLMADPLMRLKLAEIGYKNAETQTEELLRNAKLRTEIAKAENYANLPESREAQRGVQVRGQDVAAETARRGQDKTAETAAANREGRERIAAARQGLAAQAGKVPPLQQATYKKYLDIYTSKPTKNPISQLMEEPYTPEEKAQALEGLRSFGKRYKLDLSGIPGGENFETAAPTAAPAAAPARDSAAPAGGLSEGDRKKVANYINAGSFGSLVSAVKDPKAKKAVLAEYRRQTGKVWGAK